MLSRRLGYRLYLRHGALNGVMGLVPRQTIRSRQLVAEKRRIQAEQTQGKAVIVTPAFVSHESHVRTNFSSLLIIDLNQPILDQVRLDGGNSGDLIENDGADEFASTDPVNDDHQSCTSSDISESDWDDITEVEEAAGPIYQLVNEKASVYIAVFNLSNALLH